MLKNRFLIKISRIVKGKVSKIVVFSIVPLILVKHKIIIILILIMKIVLKLSYKKII